MTEAFDQRTESFFDDRRENDFDAMLDEDFEDDRSHERGAKARLAAGGSNGGSNNGFFSFWQQSDGWLKVALMSLLMTVVGALSGWIAARMSVPLLVAETTPVAIAAIVRDDDVRELMVMANLLRREGLQSDREALRLTTRYLPASLIDEEGRPIEGYLTDLHFRAAIQETADILGAPVISAKHVLAIPRAGEEKHPLATQALDITENVKALLGLSRLKDAAAREILNDWIKEESAQKTEKESNS